MNLTGKLYLGNIVLTKIYFVIDARKRRNIRKQCICHRANRAYTDRSGINFVPIEKKWLPMAQWPFQELSRKERARYGRHCKPDSMIQAQFHSSSQLDSSPLSVSEQLSVTDFIFIRPLLEDAVRNFEVATQTFIAEVRLDLVAKQRNSSIQPHAKDLCKCEE